MDEECIADVFTDKRAYRGHSLMGFFIGIPIPVMSIWLWTRLSTSANCESYINTPFFVIGCLIIIFSISGSCALKPRSELCCFRETALFILGCILLGYAIFVLAVSNSGGGRPVPGKVYQEFFLDDYSPWLQNRLNNAHYWDNHLKKCIFKKDVCNRFDEKFAKDTQLQFFSRHFSSIQSGCCKPSTDCNFNYTSPTKWSKPIDGQNNHSNKDCYKWDNDPNVLCYDCQSCKAGFANDVRSSWTIVGIVTIVVLSLLAFVSPCVSCKTGVYAESLCKAITGSDNDLY